MGDGLEVPDGTENAWVSTDRSQQTCQEIQVFSREEEKHILIAKNIYGFSPLPLFQSLYSPYLYILNERVLGTEKEDHSVGPKGNLFGDEWVSITKQP